MENEGFKLSVKKINKSRVTHSWNYSNEEKSGSLDEQENQWSDLENN